jgi:galactose-1-phosphate uridylyltransferase
MFPGPIPESSYLIRMADGTVKQVNPFTGTEVWTVPGRADRPMGIDNPQPTPLKQKETLCYCPFCPERYLETPPEKARLVLTEEGYAIRSRVHAENLFDTIAEFRRVHNLFEIVSLDYWKKNFGYTLSPALKSWRQAYLAKDAGRRHVNQMVENRLKLSGSKAEDIQRAPLEQRLQLAEPFFAGGHELIVARRHFVDGARHSDELASSGTLTPEEHYYYMRFSVDTLRDLYETNRYVRYVAVFQNWRNAAGASFEHLHKQLVAIDERGVQSEREMRLCRLNPNIYNEAAVNFASYRNLVFAENDHAIAFAGFGHRFPTLEIFSKSNHNEPWNHSPRELRAVSDLVHACHAAMGASIPCNEEWYYKPPDGDVAMPWRVQIKWRINTPAGFEGGTRIYVNTIDPETLRNKMVSPLVALRNNCAIAPFKIGSECICVPNCLKYAKDIHQQNSRRS